MKVALGPVVAAALITAAASATQAAPAHPPLHHNDSILRRAHILDKLDKLGATLMDNVTMALNSIPDAALRLLGEKSVKEHKELEELRRIEAAMPPEKLAEKLAQKLAKKLASKAETGGASSSQGHGLHQHIQKEDKPHSRGSDSIV